MSYRPTTLQDLYPGPLKTAGMAHDIAGTCDGCGNDAVELLIVREDDPIRCTLRFCRVCAGDDSWNEPGAEFEIGATLDLFGNPLETPATPERHEQLGMFEIPRTSTFEPTGVHPIAGDAPLF